MPEFRFSYTNPERLTPQIGQVTADNAGNAFNKMSEFLAKRKGKYVARSMQEFKVSSWHRVEESFHLLGAG